MDVYDIPKSASHLQWMNQTYYPKQTWLTHLQGNPANPQAKCLVPLFQDPLTLTSMRNVGPSPGNPPPTKEQHGPDLMLHATRGEGIDKIHA